MQIICTSLQTDNHSFFTGRTLFLTSNQHCQSTEGNPSVIEYSAKILTVSKIDRFNCTFKKESSETRQKQQQQQITSSFQTDSHASISSSLASLKSRLVSLFWCRLTQAVLEKRLVTSGYAMWFTAAPKSLKIQVFGSHPAPGVAQPLYSRGHN